ncbi:V8-like Glu-specific endopeptidase [Saccharothrix tamanrassetensis]|uniref:V8-like Glu-specific endopeptidase n=1 Tax=Saccharothrix tamanrassetensis TaxID=1051531 RepID=A0A841CDF8_9PSEU|nr:hypothetical protein [Saccharothrix tamanrassetensis]MBB5954394.1 V8-like Glu-specific endopeptidase [Saccharothrix tamanrassetensis]
MRKFDRSRRLLAGVGVAVAIAALLGAPAHAQAAAGGQQAPGADPPAAPVVTRAAQYSDEENPAGFWTAERMAQAVPADVLTTGNREPARRQATAQQPQRLAPAAAGQPGGDVHAELTSTNVVGKVYYKLPTGELRSCSAAAVNNPARNMVFTAGHCVHTGDGGDWMREWTFVPAKRQDDEPFGRFTAYALGTMNGWAQDSSWGYDTGIALLNGNERGRLVDVVGGNGLTVGGPFEQFRTIFGYPEDRENGKSQLTCEGNSQQASVFFPRQITIGCGLGEGSSGGPWFINYVDRPDGTGRGDVNGVTSNGDIFGNLRSPYFTNDGEGNLYRQMANG